MIGGRDEPLSQCPPKQMLVRLDACSAERERLREAVRKAIGEALGKFTRLGADPQFGQLVDVVASAAWDAAGLTPYRECSREAAHFLTWMHGSFVACECDRTEDVRLDGGCIADGELERLRAEGWVYDGLVWTCPEHAE